MSGERDEWGLEGRMGLSSEDPESFCVREGVTNPELSGGAEREGGGGERD